MSIESFDFESDEEMQQFAREHTDSIDSIMITLAPQEIKSSDGESLFVEVVCTKCNGGALTIDAETLEHLLNSKLFRESNIKIHVRSAL